MFGALSDERTGLSFITAAGSRQRSHSRVRLTWTREHILQSHIRDFPFRRLLRLADPRQRRLFITPRYAPQKKTPTPRVTLLRHAAVATDRAENSFADSSLVSAA
jgi:hypothetical protein